MKKMEGEVAPLNLVAALQRMRMVGEGAGFLTMAAADQGQEGVKRMLLRVLETAVLGGVAAVLKMLVEEGAVVQCLKPVLSLAAGGKNVSQRSSRSSEGEACVLEHLRGLQIQQKVLYVMYMLG